jgi:hypothetical protein
LCTPPTREVTVVVTKRSTRRKFDGTCPCPDGGFYRSLSISPNLASLSRHLRAENKSPATITTYAKAVVQLADFLERTARSILRALVEAACRAVV